MVSMIALSVLLCALAGIGTGSHLSTVKVNTNNVQMDPALPHLVGRVIFYLEK